MALKVDTFEHDIADEIRRKEATLEEIKVVSKSQEPIVEVPAKKIPTLTISLIILIILTLGGIGGLAYYYFHDSLLPPSSAPITIKKSDIPKITAEVAKLSPVLGSEIGRFTTSVEKKDSGYILSINNFSAVFAYMSRNENAYIEELASLFVGAELTSTTTLQEEVVVASTSPQVATVAVSTSTPKATSTTITKKATTTKSVPEKNPKPSTASTTKSSVVTVVPEEILVATTTILQNSASNSSFKDVTIANQNMRVYKNGKRTVVYSFVGDKHVLISDTPEGILALKSAIIQ